MKWAHKKDCIADCDYDVSKYILNDNYYQLTKKFTEDPHHVLIKFRITFFSFAIPAWIVLFTLGGLAIYFLYTYNNNANAPNDQIYAIVCWVLGLGFGFGTEIVILIWLVRYGNYYISSFMQLVYQGYIDSDLNAYPHLMSELLFYFGRIYHYDMNRYWIVTTDYLYYSFAVFFQKLNEYYLQHHSPSNLLTTTKPTNDK